MLTLADIGRQSIAAYARALPASNVVFYRINTALQPRDFILHGVADPMHDAYLRHYRHLDPLKPSCCVRSRQAVLPLRQAFDYQSSARNDRYQRFLAQYDIVDAVEVLVRHQGRPVAGLSVLRCRSEFDGEDLNTLRALHDLTELSVSALARTEDVTTTAVGPSLTARERDVVRLVCQGLTNKQIARVLDIGDATVKTHLINVFDKYGVHSRVALVGLCLGQTFAEGQR